MKVRNGFVSNSSSSSFVIFRNCLTPDQIDLIEGHSEVAGEDYWYITITEERVNGWTYLDNFDMETYLVETVGVKKENIHWGI